MAYFSDGYDCPHDQAGWSRSAPLPSPAEADAGRAGAQGVRAAGDDL